MVLFLRSGMLWLSGSLKDWCESLAFKLGISRPLLNLCLNNVTGEVGLGPIGNL